MPPITPLPPLSRSSLTFKEDVNAFFGTEIQTFSVQAEAARLEILAAQDATSDSAVAAATSESNAAAASEAATSAANFKGNWASLAALPLAPDRVLPKPASVYHDGAVWALLNNLADVATSQPGVSADWQELGGAWPIIRINIDTTAVPRRTYVFYGACTLTAPAISGNRKQFGIQVLPGVTGAVFAPQGADKTCGVSGSKTIDAPFSAILTDSGATDGWI